MLIGKLHLLALVGFLFVGCASSDDKAGHLNVSESWWLSEEFSSAEIEIYGIPVSEVNPSWRFASVLNKQYFESRLADNQLKNIGDSDLVFSLEANIDNTPEVETFFVGTYESGSSERGRFIAVKRDSQIIKYFTHAGFSGYSSIYLEGDELRWYKCMECGDFDSIRWTGSSYILQ